VPKISSAAKDAAAVAYDEEMPGAFVNRLHMASINCEVIPGNGAFV
jgi:hypothetical protein